MKKAVVVASCLVSSFAWAGGFEFPDNGTEALGRGGAFTAKADDATAIEYNIAGLATQRGTRVTLDANMVLSSYTFQRYGSYPAEDAPAGMSQSPYVGMAYPKVSNKGGVFFAPFFGVSTDFGKLDRWTFAIGAYGPSSYGAHDYGLTVKGPGGTDLPSPARYDLVSANLLIVYPTLAASVRVTHWLDLGVALQLVVSSFDLKNASVSDLGPILCYNQEYQPCDASTHVTTSGVTATVAWGFMLHPNESFDIGMNFRPKIDVDSSGDIDTPGPDSKPLKASGHASFHSHLPWVVRFGMRYKFMKDHFEEGDIEADATSEWWGAAEGDGDKLDVDSLGFLTNIHAKIPHHYHDTISVRLGGAYNLRLPKGVLTFRAGAYYDSAATDLADTRLDFDTGSKWGFTGGLGFKIRGVTINLAYAYIYSPDRDVKNGNLQGLNGFDGSNTTQLGPLPTVNSGVYSAHSQIFSLGLTLAFDEMLKKNRVIAY